MDKVKAYKWSSTMDAKLEHDEWFATLTEVYSKEKIGICVDETFSELFTLKEPSPPIDGTSASRLAYKRDGGLRESGSRLSKHFSVWC